MSAIFSNGFVDPAIIRGVPLVAIPSNKLFYVHSGIGASSNSGKTASKPLATVAQAFAKCTANKGDIVLCLPGHAETISAAAGWALNVAGVSIIGLGQGSLMPTVTFDTAATADINITAANISISNFRFISNIASLGAPLDVSAAGFKLQYCNFYCTSATTGFDITVITDANANDMVVEGCNFYYNTSLADTAVTDTATEVIRLVGADRAIIRNNFFASASTTAIINGITTASTNLWIRDNTFIQLSTDKHWVALVANCTGRIDYNVGTATSTAGITDANIISAASCQLAENYASDAVGETGQIVGVASA